MEQKDWEELILTATEKGVPEDQLRRFVEAKYIPYEWQLGFHAAAREADNQQGPIEIGAGGARGPGKSHAVFAQISLDDCQRFPNLKALFLRQTGKAAEESFQDLIGNVLRGKVAYDANRSVLSFPNGSRVVLGGFSDERDIDKYVGIEYDVMAVEELNQLTEEKIEKLKGSLRTSKEGWRPRLYASFNAGGLGHNFVKERFVMPHREHRETTTRFLPATYKDNPRLNKEYIDYLEGLKGDLGRAWREGDFDLFEGQFFREWRYEKHVVQPFRIPDYWRRYRAYDYGYSNPACCKWYVLDPDGRLFVYKEKYFPKQHRQSVDKQAESIVAMSINPHTELQEEYQYSVADPAIFSPTGMVDKFGGQTIAETFARYGIVWMAGSNRRVDGWSLMHQYLHWDEVTSPKLLYFNTCLDSIRTIPSLSHDGLKPEDVDSDGEDHCFIGSTLVDTIAGKIPIKDLVDKEVYVHTVDGFRKCRSVRKTRESEVWKVTLSNEVEIIVTPDHKFLTNNGWKKLKDICIGYDELVQYDICITSYLKLFKNLMENAITFVGNTFKRMVEDSILLFGNFIMGSHQKDFMFITKILIRQTMTFPILNLKRLLSIYQYMLLRKNINREAGNIYGYMPSQKQLNGISLKKEESGIAYMLKNKQKNGSGFQRIVLLVEKSIKHLYNLLIGQNTAISIVKWQPYGNAEVYDLTVPSTGNFTIHNGIVVHNCGDTDRYFLTSLHEDKTPRQLNDVEKKLEDMKKSYGITPSRLNELYYG